jgi:creatinine amidohydrolase
MQLADMKWPEIAALDKRAPIIFPIAALEQHGDHLPLFTDSMLLAEVTRRAAERAGDRIVFAPLLWLGNSDHHLDFPGTLSAAPRVYLDLLGGLAENALAHGFKRVVFLNGHGGNDVPGRQAVFEVRQRHRTRSDLLLLLATYWNLADPARLAALGLRQAEMQHACEWETSMILRLAPRLVGPLDQIERVEPGPGFQPAARAWTTKDRTARGHIGDPRAATAEKGEALLQIFADGLVDFLARVAAWDGEGWSG